MDESILNRFHGKAIVATAINLSCVEDIPSMLDALRVKFGVEPVDRGTHFEVAERKYLKPWVPRVRYGIFRVIGQQYYIEMVDSSALGRLKANRSFYDLKNLSLKDERTLVSMIDRDKDFKIEYQLLGEG